MGACYSQTRQDWKITKEIKRYDKKQSRIAKLLLLGAGQSGKSTIVKQMKLIHFLTDHDHLGFTEEEKQNAKIAVYINMVDALLTLIDAVLYLDIKEPEEASNLVSSQETLKTKGDIICKYGEQVLSSISMNIQKSNDVETSILNPSEEVLKTFKEVWSNPSIQVAYRRRNEFQLIDSTGYLMAEMDRICLNDFEPNNQDVLRTRIKTEGITRLKFQFQFGNLRIPFEIYDVGGQKGQRKNWIHCFDNVTSVLFVISIAEYDQTLEEDRNTNRMEDSMQLFGQIVNSMYFEHTPFIIFFNKYDIFQEKILTQGIQNTFPDYDGPPDSVEESLEFLRRKYLSQIETEVLCEELIYTHTTTATDTELVEYVFRDVMRAVLKNLLGEINIE